VPDVTTKTYESLLNDGSQWVGFMTYDHVMQHIFTRWRVSNCGGAARGFTPWVSNGVADSDPRTGFFQIPVNGFAPEIQIISSDFQFDWDTLGGQDFANNSLFIASSGSDSMYAMQ